MADEPTNAGFEDWLPLRAVKAAPGEYDITDRDGTVLWRMEGAALAEWVCAMVNAAPVCSAAVVYVTAGEKWKRQTDPLLAELPKATTAEEAAAVSDKLNKILSDTDAEASRTAYAALRSAVDALVRARGEKVGEG